MNVFIKNLLSRVPFPFDVHDIERVISLYHLGTILEGYRKGAITFPFIDKRGNVRTIQVKQFDKSNHTIGTDYLHSIIEKYYERNNKPIPEWIVNYKENTLKVSCLFGEQLLNKFPHNPIALVEAPKTAIYGTLYFGPPKNAGDFIWLAVYNKSSFTIDKIKVLKGREVYVFPDLSKNGNTYEEWEDKAKEFEAQLPGLRFVFSDLLESFASEEDKINGNDIADFLIKMDWRSFRNKIKEAKDNINHSLQNPENQYDKNTDLSLEDFSLYIETIPTIDKLEIYQKKSIEIENWNIEISNLEVFFNSIELPTMPIKLNQACTINNAQRFVDSHLMFLKTNKKKSFEPYLNRLKELKLLLTNH